MNIKATFGLPGKVQIRLIVSVLDGCQQKVQILLGEQWLTFSDEDAKPYVQLFDRMNEFEKYGATDFLHIKAEGLTGLVGILPNGVTAYFWADPARRDGVHWIPATAEQAAEIESCRKNVKALKSGDLVVVWHVTDVNTGGGDWDAAKYNYSTAEGYFVTTTGGKQLRTACVLTWPDAIREGLVAAQAVA